MHPQRAELKSLISRGDTIQSPSVSDRISEGDCMKWTQDVHTFSERYLKKHPAHGAIGQAIFFNKISSILGCLQSVFEDDTFWEETTPRQVAKKTESRNSPLYDVFISHANADKMSYVNDLKASLDKLGVSIFYDKDTLKWGDDWKAKILEGVEKAEFAIIVISDNFFGREWTEIELHEFLNRQNQKGQKVILPLLHNISLSQLTEKYPAVAQIQALNTNVLTCDEIALQFAARLIERLKG